MAVENDYWTEAHAKRLLEAHEKSGVSLAEFARREGVRARRLQWWRDRLRSQRASKSEATTFAPAVVKKAARVVLARGAAVVIVARSGATIEVSDPARVSPSWIAAVVRELERR
jgi:hypothetical protein